MLGQILLNRFKFLTLTEYEVSSTARSFYHVVSIYGSTRVKFFRESREKNYKFSFPKNFSIKLIDFNDENEIKLLKDVKDSFDNCQDKLTDIEIQNIFKYFEYIEKINNDKCKEYCERYGISNVKDDGKTDTPFVEEVQINW